jgi:hypothetical protein
VARPIGRSVSSSAWNPQRLPAPGDQQQIVGRIADPGADQLVAVAQVDRDESAGCAGCRTPPTGLLDQTVAGGQHEVGLHGVVSSASTCRDALVGLERQQVRHVLALGVAAALGQLVGLGR